MKALSIHIPEPCHEDWQQMTPVDRGRFCQSCAKQVVDFSMMTDQEILNYISKASGGMCGRFANDQLQRPLQPVQQEKKKAWWIAAMMPLLLLFEKAGAQKKDAKPANHVTITMKEEIQGFLVLNENNRSSVEKLIVKKQKGIPDYEISGHILEERTKEPVPFASVTVKKGNEATTTDASGYFSLRGKTTSDHIILNVASVGFVGQTVNVIMDDTTEIIPAANHTITGNVVDGVSGSTLSYASVILRGSKIGVATDANGHFNLTIPPGNDNIILDISTVGYEALQVPVILNDSDGVSNLDIIKLIPAKPLLGDVVIVAGKVSCYRKPSKTDTIPTLIRKVFSTEKFKIFPNPAIKGSNVTVEIKNKGSYSIQLFDNTGKLLQAQPFEVVNSNTQTLVVIPSSLTPGTYYIMLFDNKKKKQYTDKIIVM